MLQQGHEKEEDNCPYPCRRGVLLKGLRSRVRQMVLLYNVVGREMNHQIHENQTSNAV